MISKLLIKCGQSYFVAGISSICGILGLLFSIFISRKTHNIEKTIKHLKAVEAYNADRESFQRSFEGHRLSIVKDGNHSKKLLSDIETQLQQYKVQFSEVLTLCDKFLIFRFERQLKKDPKKANFSKICSYLSVIYGRLSKKEVSTRG